MSKKDFEIIAKVLREQQVSLAVVKAMADALSETNERFDRNRFIAAAYHGDLELQERG